MAAYYNEWDAPTAAWLRELIARKLIPDGEVDERSIADVTPDDLRGFRHCHFFAGIGGWAYALRLAGWPDDRLVWTGSPPCQPFSAAGSRRGAGDERHLSPVFLSLVRECGPPVVFGEQVSAALRFNWFDHFRSELEECGYRVGGIIAGAHSVGAPHIRQRLWIVADAGQPRSKRRQDQQRPAFDNTPKRDEETTDHQRGGATGLVADAGKPGTRRDAGGGGRTQAPGVGEPWPHGRADADALEPCGAVGIAASGGRERQRHQSAHGEPVQAGAWIDAEWLPCLDGKARTVEPGTFPLVDGLPRGVVPSCDISVAHAQNTAEGRVMRLKGYGNAIVPAVAEQVIRAYLDITE